MAKIAADTNAFCKYSALVTEASEGWTVDDLRPYVEHVFEVFGPERMIWGSDWPVSRLARGYDDWRAAALELTTHLSEAEKAAVFGGNAKAFYRLDV
jgi:L-fuconolactonase